MFLNEHKVKLKLNVQRKTFVSTFNFRLLTLPILLRVYNIKWYKCR